MYIDWTYIILVLPAVLFASWAQMRVNSIFKKYSQTGTSRNVSGYDAARAILDANGLRSVPIERVRGDLTDHYDPQSRVLRLSDSVFGSTSAAAVGVAAHEAGHAVQHAAGYRPLAIRNAIVPICNFGSKIAFPLVLIGILFSSAGAFFVNLAYVGVACFGLVTLFQLVTLPTEFNASNRAMAGIQACGLLNAEDSTAAKKVLWAAAMTYVAALAVSLMQLLRLLLLVGGNNRRR